MKFILLTEAKNLDFYASLDRKTFVISTSIPDIKFKSSNYIEVSYQSYSSSGRNFQGYQFTLCDDKFYDIFKYLVEDIKEKIIENKDITLQDIKQRYDKWYKFFKKSSLSLIEIQGLFSELYVLKNFILPKLGSSAISTWKGPSYSKKDFMFDNTWIEVKSHSPEKAQIEISSIEQLDEEKEGYLCTVESKEVDNGNNIFSLLCELEQIISKEEMDNLYLLLEDMNLSKKQLLDEANYINQHYYDIGNVNFYIVNQEFPRISRVSIPDAIEKVKYTLNLLLLDEFKVEIEGERDGL